MASPAFEYFDAEYDHGSVRFRNAAGTGKVVTNVIATELRVSSADALQGARGAMVAVGIESAMAACVCAGWIVWHLLR